MLQAYQTVRIGLLVKRTRSTVKMPSWAEVMGRGANTLKAGDSKEKGLAFMQVLAARVGGTVRLGKRKGRKS